MAEKPLSGQAAAGRATFGLLPEAERSVGSFITSMAINGLMLAVFSILERRPGRQSTSTGMKRRY